MKVVTTNSEHINTLTHRHYPNMACNLLIFGLLTFLPSAITSSIIVNNGNNNGFRASDYLNLGSTNGHRDVPHCPNITRNSRLKCAQSLDVQACGCYVKAYRRWLNSSVSVSHEKASCCSKLEVRNCVERLLRNEKRDCKPRWEKEAKRYTELVLPLKEYSCRDYRKQEYCKLESINLTLIILLITVALLAIIACLGFTGYACYRRYNE